MDQETVRESLMPKPKNTGLASFTDAPQDEDEKPSLSRYRKKAKGEWVHIQMRMTHGQWVLATQFADSEGISMSLLGLIGISRLRQEKGLPPLPDLPNVD
jgi:hypothetical protein